MREIKFREWDFGVNGIRGPGWYYWGYIDGQWKGTIYSQPHESQGEYTGLKDKSGKGREIYEGDILKCNQFSAFVEIKWDIETMSLRMKSNDPYQFFWQDFESWIFKENVLTNFEIIGNVYENPELLNDSTTQTSHLQK